MLDGETFTLVDGNTPQRWLDFYKNIVILLIMSINHQAEIYCLCMYSVMGVIVFWSNYMQRGHITWSSGQIIFAIILGGPLTWISSIVALIITLGCALWEALG